MSITISFVMLKLNSGTRATICPFNVIHKKHKTKGTVE